MNPFSPEPKKKEFEPQPLHVELYPPPAATPKKEEEIKEERGVIIIELW